MFPKFSRDPNNYYKTVGGLVVDGTMGTGILQFAEVSDGTDGNPLIPTTLLDEFQHTVVSVVGDTTADSTVVDAFFIDSTGGRTDISGNITILATYTVIPKATTPNTISQARTQTDFLVTVSGQADGDNISVTLNFGF